MTDEELERFKQAIENGEVIKIIYDGGSQPGTMREITPVSIDGDRVWAICMESNRHKSFSARKIKFHDGENAREYKAKPEVTVTWPDLAAFIEETRFQFEATCGLYPQGMTNENGELVGVGYHELKKDGKPRLHPTLKLEYVTTRREQEMDAEGRVVYTVKPRTKYWVLSERGQNPRSYSKMDSAARELLKRTIGFDWLAP